MNVSSVNHKTMSVELSPHNRQHPNNTKPNRPTANQHHTRPSLPPTIAGLLQGYEIQRSPGPVLHQPLSCSLFWKKRLFCQKMNGPAVCLGQKTENAPTWRSPRPLFGGLFLVLFHPILSTILYQPPILLFYILTSIINNGMGTLN